MRRLVAWFRNLKKWQKGGLIGCAVGLLFASVMIIAIFFPNIFFPSLLYSDSPGAMIVLGIVSLHLVPLLIALYTSSYILHIGLVVVIIVFYGVFGAIVGRVQQVASPFRRWPLTALLVIFLLFIYLFNLRF
jgi:hypothetical protein